MSIRTRLSTHSNTIRRLRFESLETRCLLDGMGLTAQYFHNSDFTIFAGDRTEAVDFSWGTSSPFPGVDSDSFSVRWVGQVEPEFSESYVFRTLSNDGVRLWVDGQLLVDNWTTHELKSDYGIIDLIAGQRYDIRLEYFDSTGDAEIRLQWRSASQPIGPIPASRLYASVQGIYGEYRDSLGMQVTRIDPAINSNWGVGRPIDNIAADGFNVRWTGYLRADFTETYTFRTMSDEGIRLWIDGELVIDHWEPHSFERRTNTKRLEAGRLYSIRVDYYDGTDAAGAQLSWSSPRQTGENVFQVIGDGNLLAAKTTPLLVQNPLGQGQDPFAIRWNDSYLLVRSTDGSIWIDQSEQLQDLHPSRPYSTTVQAWTPPAGTNYSQQVWAPELFQFNGKWYIYVAASDGANANHRMHVLERDDPNPMGPYTYKGQLAATTDRWAIDGTVLDWQGQLYFIWSGWPGFSDGQQNLYIAHMSNPWTIDGERTLLATPQYSWERYGLPINEGPQVLIHDGQLHIIYSASGYWTHQYALGRLTYGGVGPITSASSWTKSPSPVFKQSGEVVGVGHASFVKSPDGTEDWIVYHSHPSPTGNPDLRVVRIQQFAYDANGMPDFGVPLQPNVRIEAPSPSSYIFPDLTLIPGDFNADSSVDALDVGIWQTSYGTSQSLGFLPGDGDYDGWVGGRDFLIWQRKLGQSPLLFAASTAANPEVLMNSPSAPSLRDEVFSGFTGLPTPYLGVQPGMGSLQMALTPSSLDEAEPVEYVSIYTPRQKFEVPQHLAQHEKKSETGHCVLSSLNVRDSSFATFDSIRINATGFDLQVQEIMDE